MKRNKKTLYGFLLSFIFLITSLVYAMSDKNTEVIQSFKNMLELAKIEIVTPTVVEVPIPNQVFRNHFAVYNKTKDRFEPYQVFAGNDGKILPQSININSSPSNLNLSDNKYDSSLQFDLNENLVGYVEVEYNFNEALKSDAMYLLLDRNVSLPNRITIKAVVDGIEKVIVSRAKPTSSVINFPVTSSTKWVFEIEYSQLLRINELQLNNLNQKIIPTNVRFLAQPQNDYIVYYEPEVIIKQSTGEMPNLSDTKEVKKITEVERKDNPQFKLADSDNDAIPDINDNCVSVSNFDQVDVNQNGRGDVCDDFDKDGVINSKDNCINEPNSNQADIDLDEIGDACDDEESRITEKYPWLVWGGLSFAGLIFLGLFAIALRRIRFAKNDSNNIDLNI